MREVIYNFTGKKFVVTGASSGMGRQIALELAEAGAIVLAIARRQAELESLKAEYPEHIIIGVANITDNENIENLIKNFVMAYGKLNGCVHAAGIGGLTPLKAFNVEEAKKIMEVSFWSGINLIQLTTKKKYAEQGSSYILFSSVSAYTGEKGMFAYSSTKAALQVAVKSIAKEICSNKQRINTISPGWVKTQMTDQANQMDVQEDVSDKHLLGTGNVEDVSGVVLFLLSERASWITGTDIIVDGGYLA